jgi:GNAT superfamily N-acetyltransferase
MPARAFVTRRARAEDAEAIVDILRALGQFTRLGALPPKDALDRVRRSLAQYSEGDGRSAYVAHEPSGPVLGYVTVHWLPYLFMPGPEGFVSELFVHPDAAGNGIGSRLLEEVTAEAQKRGCVRLSLINMRQRESYKRGFYGKRGWEERVDAANLIYPLPQT